MPVITFEMRGIKELADQLKVAHDQIPYATAKALNDAAFRTRDRLIAAWPQHVTARNTGFIRSALHIEKASKHDLTVRIVETPSSVSLERHAAGGTKRPLHSRNLAIPPKGSVQYGPRGVRSDQRPGAILRNTPKRALRVTSKGIFVGEGGRLHLKYTFTPSAHQPKDIPFYEVFASEMRDKVNQLLPVYLQEAMRSRR
jgi:hypothetical protein